MKSVFRIYVLLPPSCAVSVLHGFSKTVILPKCKILADFTVFQHNSPSVAVLRVVVRGSCLGGRKYRIFSRRRAVLTEIFRGFILSLQNKCLDCILNEATISYIDILPNCLFTDHPTSRLCSFSQLLTPLSNF
jgi:hypothetical protein